MMGLKKCFGINKFEIMDKTDVYKSLVEIGNAISLAETCIKHKYKLPDILIARLNKLGDLGSDIEAYARATGDKDIIKEIDNLQTTALHQVNGWYAIEQQTRLSIALCNRSLYRVANMWQPQQIQEYLTIPDGIDTNRARKYFSIAIEREFIEPTSNGYSCLKSKAQLGYFLERVFCPNNTEVLPEKLLNKLFGVDRIGSAITQNHNTKKPPKWKNEIDSIFD